MDSIRSRLEALLEQDLLLSNKNSLISDSPLLSQDLDFFYIETPAKLKDPSSLSTKPLHIDRACPTKPVSLSSAQGPQPSFASKPPLPNRPTAPKSNFGYFFADPTPLSLISDSPLVTPLRFLH